MKKWWLTLAFGMGVFSLSAQRGATDLTVCYIKRLPEIPYVEHSKNPAAEGWAKEGDTVVWRAWVKNFAPDTLRNVAYEFHLNSRPVLKGSFGAIAPGAMVFADYPAPWAKRRDAVTFVVDANDAVEEASELNNRLTVYTDAITANFYVEQGLYDYFHENQHKLGVGRNGWEDWAQAHVARWNRMFAEAVFPDSPSGVLDRIRIDSIAIVPDGALPLNGGLPTNNPDTTDKTVDLLWGFVTAGIEEGNTFYKNVAQSVDGNPCYFEGSLLHELGHARYLLDMYGFGVSAGKENQWIRIEEQGEPVAGSRWMPYIWGDVVHDYDYKGLMGSQYVYIDAYSAACLNRIAGHRAVCGNMNSPCNIGEFANDLPAKNFVTLRDQEGNLLGGADVKVFRADGVEGAWYGKQYDNVPDMELRANGKGVVSLGRNPFTEGKIEHTYGISNGVIIVRVEKDGKVGYGFLESTHFNMEYWRGNQKAGHYTMTFQML